MLEGVLVFWSLVFGARSWDRKGEGEVGWGELGVWREGDGAGSLEEGFVFLCKVRHV